jgi:hypothetical protein
MMAEVLNLLPTSVCRNAMADTVASGQGETT